MNIIDYWKGRMEFGVWSSDVAYEHDEYELWHIRAPFPLLVAISLFILFVVQTYSVLQIITECWAFKTWLHGLEEHCSGGKKGVTYSWNGMSSEWTSIFNHLSLTITYRRGHPLLDQTTWWYAPWPSTHVKHISGRLSTHIWSLHIFATYSDFYWSFLIFSTHILDFLQLCINLFIFAEHLDISTYHMTSSPDPTTWYQAPYYQHLIILMTIAHGHLLCIIPFPCGTSPIYSKLIVFWTNGLRKDFHILQTFPFLVLLFLPILLIFSPLVISFVIWNIPHFLIFVSFWFLCSFFI
jgi:hypothetical protein